MDTIPIANYPLPTKSSLQWQYVGKNLNDVFTPAVVIDRSVVKRNCDAMLEVSKALGVGFRAHVKSHKTLELSKMQVGEDGPANFVVSTLIEAENLLSFLLECQAKDRPCSVIYGVPIPQSAVSRLLCIANKVQPGTLSVLIDNLDAFLEFEDQLEKTPNARAIGVYLKIDVGYQRAGTKTDSPKFGELVRTVIDKAGENFKGFYTHFGHSYGGSSEDDAANGLLEELTGLEVATRAVPKSFKGRLVLTVGATPTATAAQNLLSKSSEKAREFKSILDDLKQKYSIELHAGVYPLLDLQQVATHARPPVGEAKQGFEPLSRSNIGLKMLVEVTSVYEERAKPEALVSAGSLALGREPCKSYPGWGVVTADLGNSGGNCIYDDRGNKTGWIVGRISQEHAILTWEGPKEKAMPLSIGDKILIWPNHACVAGAGFGWYLVVDSTSDTNTIVDVWVRWRGW
ncbi:hypothetical protein CC78DRAFT_273266 [Lojkania enalia]|uniref:D-serine dehydratase n=1 Tax=Lojkania enalia TaxID=147567 RepID=A0A9P4K7L2_9PLEO|nr:hypothetical protein CC78DRAFT_273266 [Didymosphaeria enalia]